MNFIYLDSIRFRKFETTSTPSPNAIWNVTSVGKLDFTYRQILINSELFVFFVCQSDFMLDEIRYERQTSCELEIDCSNVNILNPTMQTSKKTNSLMRILSIVLN